MSKNRDDLLLFNFFRWLLSLGSNIGWHGNITTAAVNCHVSLLDLSLLWPSVSLSNTALITFVPINFPFGGWRVNLKKEMGHSHWIWSASVLHLQTYKWACVVKHLKSRPGTVFVDKRAVVVITGKVFHWLLLLLNTARATAVQTETGLLWRWGGEGGYRSWSHRWKLITNLALVACTDQMHMRLH